MPAGRPGLTEQQRAERAAAAQAVGERIRQRREKLGLTQDQLARKSGYAVGERRRAAPAISQIENGNRGHLPGPDSLRRICNALGTTTKELFQDIPKPR